MNELNGGAPRANERNAKKNANFTSKRNEKVPEAIMSMDTPLCDDDFQSTLILEM